jgi:hypothetical protein
MKIAALSNTPSLYVAPNVFATMEEKAARQQKNKIGKRRETDVSRDADILFDKPYRSIVRHDERKRAERQSMDAAEKDSANNDQRKTEPSQTRGLNWATDGDLRQQSRKMVTRQKQQLCSNLVYVVVDCDGRRFALWINNPYLASHRHRKYSRMPGKQCNYDNKIALKSNTPPKSFHYRQISLFRFPP